MENENVEENQDGNHQKNDMFSHSILSPIPTQQPQKAGWTTNSYFTTQEGQKIKKLKAEQQISMGLNDRRGTTWVN